MLIKWEYNVINIRFTVHILYDTQLLIIIPPPPPFYSIVLMCSIKCTPPLMKRCQSAVRFGRDINCYQQRPVSWPELTVQLGVARRKFGRSGNTPATLYHETIDDMSPKLLLLLSNIIDCTSMQEYHQYRKTTIKSHRRISIRLALLFNMSGYCLHLWIRVRLKDIE